MILLFRLVVANVIKVGENKNDKKKERKIERKMQKDSRPTDEKIKTVENQ